MCGNGGMTPTGEISFAAPASLLGAAIKKRRILPLTRMARCLDTTAASGYVSAEAAYGAAVCAPTKTVEGIAEAAAVCAVGTAPLDVFAPIPSGAADWALTETDLVSGPAAL